MAARKRGPYVGESRTTKWRKKSREEDNMPSFENTEELDSLPETDEFSAQVEEILARALEEESDQETNNVPGKPEDQPVYPGCSLTVATSMLLIVTYAMRHCLTGVALCDLLVLIELHCLSDNLCHSTLSMYQRFFRNLKTPIVYNYFCEQCHCNIGAISTEICPNCSSARVRHFLTIPVVKQLESILKKPNILKEIEKTKFSLKTSCDDNISDVFNGKLYQEHFTKEGFFRGSDHIKENDLHLSLQINTDGVAIFRSSKFGVWPVYATINELPPNLRYTRENRLFIGLWFGQEKPIMKLLMSSLLNELDLLYKGVTIDLNGETSSINLKVIVLSMVADAPARCLMMEFVQFNGNYGCPCCYTKGETFAISERGNSHTYPYDLSETFLHQGHSTLRTHQETLQLASEVEKRYIQGKKRNPEPEMGVKGLSLMSLFPTFNLIRGTTIDYMHCVLLGVVKMIMGLWTDLEHRNEAWSVRQSIETINERLRKMSPPNLISRLPRNIDDLGDWKASELRTFLLFYSIPILSDILASPYLQNFSDLVVAIHVLLRTKISQKELQYARTSLKRFCAGIETLYGDRYATFNVHSLLHLCDKVQDLGPLWAHSCFFYEGLNGDLRNQFHGTQQVEIQISTAICVQQKIPELIEGVNSCAAKSFYEDLTGCRRTIDLHHKIAEATYQMGASHIFNPTTEIVDMLQSKFGNVSEYRKFFRVFYHGLTLHSRDYAAVKRRNTFTLLCTNGFYQVLYYIQCATVDGYRYGAVAEELLTDDQDTGCKYNHIKRVVHGSVTPIDMCDIQQPVVYLNLGRMKYVASFPNLIEKD